MFVSSSNIDKRIKASKEEDLALVGTFTEEQIEFEPDKDIASHTIKSSNNINSETTLIITRIPEIIIIS